MDAVKWKVIPKYELLSSEETGIYATHQGWFEIAGYRIKCYQLNDGTRVFDADSLAGLFNGMS